ncbi:MAG: phosphodiester glycosidase family protein [Balneola sp.]
MWSIVDYLARKLKNIISPRFKILNPIPYILSSILFIIPTSFVDAQTITWTEKTPSVDLPSGVKFYEGVRENPKFKAWYLEVDLNVSEIALVPYLAKDGTETITNFSSRENTFATINGGYFGGSISYSTLINPGQVLAQNISSLTRNSKGYPVIRSMFGIKEDRSMSVDWIYHFGGNLENLYKFEEPLPYTSSSDNPLPAPQKADGMQYSDAYMGVGGGPILVKGDSVHVSYNEEIFWGSGVGKDDADPRTAVGYTNDGKAILMVVDGRQSASLGVSLPELAQIMIDLGATEAINLDGGGSSQMAIGDSLINRPSGGTFQRSVATFLSIVDADSIPKEPVVDFEEIIDTGDDSASVSSGWSESANSGFYGETKSLIALGGDGSVLVEFKPDLPDEGLFELYGWWVSSGNRAKQAPFIVQHSSGTDTVYADQTINNSQWIKLGEYTFAGSNSDKVIISNFGVATDRYVVADAIRFVGIENNTGVYSEDEYSTPANFRILPAYPNPFNPSTTINYVLSVSSTITVEVFDIVGRKVTTLFSGKKNNGTHTISWNASSQSSGVYLIKVKAENSSGSFTDIQKVTLIK